MASVRAMQRRALGGAAAVGRELRALASPAGVRGALVETAWVTTHVALYPLGLGREPEREWGRNDLRGLSHASLSLLTSDFETASTPILLLHGMIDNRSIFGVLSRQLRRRGFQRVHTVSYPPTTRDIRGAAQELADVVEELCAVSGHDRIDIVGHSLGGLIARYYVQRLGGDRHVETLATLGTPHAGTHAARLLPYSLTRQLRPTSELYAELALPAPGMATRVVAYWSDLDQMIVPKAHARCDHPDILATNVLVRHVGHLSLPIDSGVVADIGHRLSRPSETPPAEDVISLETHDAADSDQSFSTGA